MKKDILLRCPGSYHSVAEIVAEFLLHLFSTVSEEKNPRGTGSPQCLDEQSCLLHGKLDVAPHSDIHNRLLCLLIHEVDTFVAHGRQSWLWMQSAVQCMLIPWWQDRSDH